jgi:sirohydrochlorin ferrochelatase
VAPEAPALVLAIPGTAENDPTGIGPEVAAIAELSCPGVDIRVGYVDGNTQTLSEALEHGEDSDAQDQFPSVVVPLLISPSAKVDDAIRRVTGQSAVPAVVAAHLGPHPLVAEALHYRLAEAGLARHSRSAGLSISADGRGVVVLAAVGEEAASEASLIAVLLASRLSVPVVPASLGDPASIADAVTRIADSGASRPALSPCLIGPGTTIAVFDDLSAALGTPCAAPLGAHQAIGQLVAIRYGAALATLSLAG